MYIEAVPNRNSPPAILLRESFREDGKIKKRTLANLTDWPKELIEGFRALLKGGTVIAAEREAVSIRRSLPHGHVAAALGTLRATGLDRILGPAGNRCRDLVIAMAVSRLIAPASKLATARGLDPATAVSSLGEVLGLGESVAGAELIAIREGEVTLRTGGALRTVRLFPDVDVHSEAVPQAQPPKQDAARPRAKAKPREGAADDATR